MLHFLSRFLLECLLLLGTGTDEVVLVLAGEDTKHKQSMDHGDHGEANGM